MPSPVGHCLAGLCGYFAAPGERGGRRAGITLAASVLLANLPDADAIAGLMAGAIAQFHRTASHSLTAVLATGLLAGAVFRWRTGGRAWAWGLWGGCLYLSHLVLDLLVRDPSPPFGIQLLWPISTAYFISPFTPFRRFDYAEPGRGLFETVFTHSNFLTISNEVLLLGPCVIVFWAIGRARKSPLRQPQ